MGNMGMAENEYHQKMLRLGQADAEQVAATDPAYVDRLVCSWCGDDFEQGDFASTSCCNCDPVPVASLPELLKDARREAKEAIDAGFDTEAALATTRQALTEIADGCARWEAWDKTAEDQEHWRKAAIARVSVIGAAARRALAATGTEQEPA